MGKMPSFLVIGCGSIGRRHIANLQQLGVKDITGLDISEERRKQTEDELGIATVSAVEQGWETNPAVAVITTPTSLHIPMATEAAKRGCHLFIEKPLGDGMSGVAELLKEIKQHGLVTLVGCNMRFHHGPATIKDLLAENAIGQIISAHLDAGQYLPDWHPWEDYRQLYAANASMGGGVVLDGIHEIDYARWLFGEIDTIYAQGGKLSSLEIDTEETVDILMKTAAGHSVSIHMDYVQRMLSRTCKIIGEEGTISWDINQGEVRLFKAADKEWHSYPNPPDYDINQMYVDELAHFLRCIDGQELPILDVADAARVLEITLAAKESMLSGNVGALSS